MNKNEYIPELFIEFLLLAMQILMLIFVDGGILSGTPHNIAVND